MHTSPYIIPTQYFFLKDSFVDEKKPTDEREVLAQYTDDVYKMLIRRLSRFEMRARHSSEDEAKIRSLFEEFIRAKLILNTLETDTPQPSIGQ